MAVNEVMNHFVKTFEANAIHLVQQRYSKFRSRVIEKSPGPSEKHAFRVVDTRGNFLIARSGTVGANAGKRTATVFTDTVFNDRVAVAQTYSTADSFSKPDMRRMLEDPQSEIYKAMVPQVGRTYDDIINTAFFASANDSAGNANAWAGTTIGGAAEAFDITDVINLLEAFNADEIDPDEEKFLSISPDGVSKLLVEPKATSVDYVNAKALMSGKVVEGWLGFSWIMSNRLTIPATTQRYYPAWTRDAMGLLVLADVEFEAGKDPGTSFDTVMQLSIDAGAVRIQDKKVKRIHVLE
jgi:hypothetical protein